MSEYIEKSELLETLKEFKPDINDFDWANAECEHIQNERYQAKLDMFMDLISIIERIPTADVIPVVHAHWIEAEQEGIIVCSNCGHREFKIETRPGFCCRRCTAKMDEVIE